MVPRSSVDAIRWLFRTDTCLQFSLYLGKRGILAQNGARVHSNLACLFLSSRRASR